MDLYYGRIVEKTDRDMELKYKDVDGHGASMKKNIYLHLMSSMCIGNRHKKTKRSFNFNCSLYTHAVWFEDKLLFRGITHYSQSVKKRV